MRPSSSRWSVCAAIVFGLLPSLAGPARAEVEPAQLLLVGVTRSGSAGGRADSRLTRALSEHLLRNGEAMVRASLLTGSERLCADQDCLQRLGERTAADLVMTARVDERAPGLVTLRVALLDVDRRAPRELEGVCEPCTPPELSVQLNALGERILREHRAQPAPLRPVETPAVPVVPIIPLVAVAPPEPAVRLIPPSSGEPPPAALSAPSSPAAPAPKRPSLSLHTLPTWRKATAGALGGLALATLVPAIVLSALQGTVGPETCAAPGEPQKCVYRNAGLFGAGYALSGLFTVGVGLTLFLPDASRERPQVAPSSVGSVASALTLTPTK